MKHALQHCRKRYENYSIAAFFFNARGDLLEKTPLGMLRSILHQLLDIIPQLFSKFFSMFLEKQRYFGEKFDWHLKELQQFLTSNITCLCGHPVIIFID